MVDISIKEWGRELVLQGIERGGSTLNYYSDITNLLYRKIGIKRIIKWEDNGES